jgi:cytochrome oxidase Cu insertion factor (SCO1/SenC/PrrC family)
MALGPLALFALTIVTAVATGGPPRAGQPAPDFVLKDQNGRDVRLSDFRGKKSVVLAFYIRAFTPG